MMAFLVTTGVLNQLRQRRRPLIAGAAGVLIAISGASAHVALEQQQAAVGSAYKGVLRVLHGCEGTATTAIRVRIPDGVISVKPMPKPGWQLNVVSGKYSKPYTLHGAKVTEGVTELSWSGGKLPDAYYDEFVFTSALAEELEAGKAVYFPVVQECEKGIHRWIEIPKDGGDGGHGEGGQEPAPGVRLLPKR
jgi:periplasmic copper chaperone A